MATKISVAVMHCTKKEPERVIDRGLSVSETMYVNPTEYATPPETKVNLDSKITAAANAQALVKDGGKFEKANRDTLVAELFALLENTLLPYVNGLYKGDRSKLMLSGFPVSDDPAPHSVPAAPVIKSIEKGPEPHSAKIILAKTTSPLSTKRERLTYFVWMGLGEEEAELKNVLTVTNRHKLIITGLTRGKEYVFTVSCRNAAGGGELATKVRYIAT